jgi:hypothetical protein
MKKSARARAAQMPLSRLQQAIEDTYLAFAGARRPARLLVCPCCLDQGMVDILQKTPLRQLSSRELMHYAHAVLLTSGSVADFRYFLPRLLELSIQEGISAYNLELLLGKLRLAEWQTWPAELRTPLLNLFDVAFDEALAQPDDPADAVDSWICALALSGLDVTTYLRRLEAPERLAVLGAYYWANSQSLSKGRLSKSFWSKRSSEATRVVQWFLSQPVQEAINRYHKLTFPDQ